MGDKVRAQKVIPAHVVLIPDGNRRWAHNHQMTLLRGYSLGIKKFIELALWSKKRGVRTLTVWALSTENLKNRTSVELKVLFDLYTRAARDKGILSLLKECRAKMNIIGDLSALPVKLRTALLDMQEESCKYADYFTINLLINYGGKEDLMHSFEEASREVSRRGGHTGMSEELVQKHLRTAGVPDADLVIRTSGEMRLSGLLPWQTAYSELYFTKKYWPEFKKADFRRALDTFSRRQRRFGK